MLDLEKVRAAGGELVEALDPIELARLPASESGNAVRFTRRFGHRFRFVPEVGWYGYTGTHWSLDKGLSLARLAARETVELIHEEARAVEAAGLNRPDPGELHRLAVKSGSARSIGGLLSLAQDDCTAALDDFDRESAALNVLNGTLRFERDESEGWFARLDPHAAADRISRIAAVRYDPNADAPLWRAHVERMQPDPLMRAYIQRIFGYAMLGRGREQAFFVFQGRGGDGKSTTVNTVRRVLGAYAAAADVRMFLANDRDAGGGDKASPALARLAGDVRLVSTSEPPKGSKLNEGLVKAATGGAPLAVRHLNRGLFEYIPGWIIVLECNALPFIPGEDDGIWRRAKLIPWRVQLRRQDMDPTLENKLFAEGSGVLNWLVEGALDYLERGSLAEPAVAREALEDFRRGSNVFGEWIAEALFFDPKASETHKALYSNFASFCEVRGYEVMNTRAFGKALSNQQIITMSGPGGRTADKQRDWIRFGARLKTPEEMSADIDAQSAGQIAAGDEQDGGETVAEFETV